MKITVSFDSLEELFKAMPNIKTPDPISNTLAEAKKKAEPAVSEPATPEPELNEDLRIAVRKALAQLNKKLGRNVASELISSIGHAKLTEVPLTNLPTLMTKAKEMLNAN